MDALKNFALGTVSTGYDDEATEIVLTTDHGARFPTTACNLVWWNSTDYSNPADDPNVEIVRMTARSTDTLTIARAQEGTSAATHNTGGKAYSIMLSITSGQWDEARAVVIEVPLTGPGEKPVNGRKFYFDFEYPGTLTKFQLKAQTAPTTSAVTADLSRNAAWGSAPATFLNADASLAATAFEVDVTSFANTAITAGDVGEIEITAVDSGATCANLSAIIHYIRS